MSCKRYFYWLLIVTLLPFAAKGQKIRFYNSEQGLPNSLIHKVAQDKRGYIWIATDNGASYFDGKRFTTFNADSNNPGAIVNNQVKTVFTDSKGVIWVGTVSGLQIFDAEKNTFRDFPLQYPSFTGTPYISSITESNDQKKLFVSVSGCGILIYDIETHLIDLELTEKLKSEISFKYAGNLVIDSNDCLWSFSEQGYFFRFDLIKTSFEKIHWSPELKDQADNIVVSTIAEDPVHHKMIIGTYDHGLFIYDKALGYVRRPKGKCLERYQIRTIIVEDQKKFAGKRNVWLGTEDAGLKLFNLDDEVLITPDFQYAPIDLNRCKVHSLLQDHQGNIWAAIFQKGLLIIPSETNNFEYIKLSETQGSTSVNVACATSITRDKTGQLWVGTDGGGVFRISSDGKKTQYTKDNTPLPNNAVLALAADKRGKIWISTYIGGITSYDSKEGFKLYSTDRKLKKVISMLYDASTDKLYMGTLGNGVFALSVESNTLESVTNPEEVSWVNSMFLDHKHRLWIGCTDGLKCLNTVTGEECFPNIVDKMKGFTINAFSEGDDSVLWIGTTDGLFRYQNNEFIHYTKTDGLPGNIISSIEKDAVGNLWIGTFSGLSNFDLQTCTFRNYYAYDGLQDNEFRAGTTYKDADDKLFFGGVNGITTFHSEDIENEERKLSEIYFTQLNVLNKRVDYEEQKGEKNILDRHISQARQIKLKRNQNVFELEFAVLEYSIPQKVVYGYKLNGFDADWRYTNSDNRVATYTNIPEGNYEFSIKAFFEGNFNENDVVYNHINIRILPPWYKTWWAFLIYLSFFMFLVWNILNYLIRRKIRIREHNELEKKEMRLRMFTDLSHEIRTPLTLILTPLQSLRENETNTKQKDILNLMYRNALRILRLFNQMLDVRRIENHQLQLKFQKTDLIFFIRDIMQSFSQLAILRNIDFRLVSSYSELDMWLDQVNFDKVLFNVFSNAFKFTPDNGYILISVDTCKNNFGSKLSNDIDEYVEICIENSGSQIKSEELTKVFDRYYQSRDNNTQSGSGIGLHLAKMIVSLHYGDIQARNFENGVDFIIQVPLGDKHLKEEEIIVSQQSANLFTHNENEKSNETEYLELTQTESDTNKLKKQKSKWSIVVIDDDFDLGRYLQMVLADEFSVEVYTDVKTAWKEISTVLPDAVITDLLMADIDGLSLCKRIKQNPETNHIPVIILTSQTDEESRRVCIENGAEHYLTKPINIDLLQSSIKQVINTREMLRNKFKANFDSNLDNVKISSPDNRLVAKVIEVIRKNIENPDFSVDELSKEVGLSRVHLNRKLKENINVSPNNLIKSMRLKQAAYLLINNKVNVSDVAYKVGFSSHSYFSNNFKEYFGMAPTEFVAKYSSPEEKENLNKLFSLSEG